MAWGAQMVGCDCVIYLHEKVSQTREAEIAHYGSRIARVPGGYDNSVHQCALDAKANGWELVADTSANADAKAPSLVMQGYTLLVDEMMRQIGPELPTHIIVPGAVGGLAAAAVGHLWETLGADRPRIIVVQPATADCIARSIAAGSPTQVPGEVDTFMACLAAAEVSPAAWKFSITASMTRSPSPTRPHGTPWACSPAASAGIGLSFPASPDARALRG